MVQLDLFDELLPSGLGALVSTAADWGRVSGKTFPVVDPRTEERLEDVAEGDAVDIDKVVASARKAFTEGPCPKMSSSVSTNQSSKLLSARNCS